VRLAGVEAIVAEGFERIHRTNLVGMGVLPLEFKPAIRARPSPSTVPRLLMWKATSTTCKPDRDHAPQEWRDGAHPCHLSSGYRS